MAIGTAALCCGALVMPSFAAKHGVVSPASISVNAIPVCFDFGCRSRSVVSLPLDQWAQIGELFLPSAATPKGEREQIAKAVGSMEVFIGTHTPTHNDLAFGLPKNDEPVSSGQLDCIDEAVNTTTYLRLFAQSGFLKHHRVIDQAYRRSLFTQHWAGQIEEINKGVRWAVDSWFRPNGDVPIIQQSDDWKDLSFFSYLRKKMKNKRT